MQTSRQLRCEQCGHESDSQYRFCGMCGSRLPAEEARNGARGRAQESSSGARQVSGPSFLGLADEPTDQVAYLFEDESSGSGWARLVVAILLLTAIAAAGWHWRANLRQITMRAIQRNATSQPPQQTTYKASPISTSGSEVAGTTPNAEAITPTNSDANPTQAAPGAPQSGAPPVPATQAPATNQPASGQPPVTSSADSNGQHSQNTPLSNSAQASAPGSGSTPAENSATTKSDQPALGNASSKKQAITPASSNRRGTAASANSTDASANNNHAAQEIESEGEKYLYGTGVPANCALAQKNLLAAAEQSNSRAASVLGTMYATGHCVARDLPLAYFWFAKAMQQEPNNDRLERDLTTVWSEMTADERQVAIHHRQ